MNLRKFASKQNDDYTNKIQFFLSAIQDRLRRRHKVVCAILYAPDMVI